MGTHIYTQILIGIKINEKEYTKEELGPAWWCNHMEFEGNKEKFCPECGKKRPREETKTYEVVEWGKFPKPFIDELRKAIKEKDGGDLEDFGIGELASTYNPNFDGKINLLCCEDGSGVYLGVLLGDLGGYETEERVLSIDTLSTNIEDVKEGISSLGFDVSLVEFVMYSYWA